MEENAGPSPSHLIDARIALADWRGATLARVRALINRADPEVVEEWKWRGVPVWSHDGIICTGEKRCRDHDAGKSWLFKYCSDAQAYGYRVSIHAIAATKASAWSARQRA